MYTIYMTTKCNFSCSYCYERFNSNISLNKDKMIEIIDFIFQYDKKHKIEISFLGGEPLLEKELIIESVNYIKEKYSNRITDYYITTNGSLIDDEFIDFMYKNKFQVRISFDGCKRAHVLNRHFLNNSFSYEYLLNNILKVNNNGINCTIRMTVSSNTLKYAYESIVFLVNKGLKKISFIPDINMKITEDLLEEFKTQIHKISNFYMYKLKFNDKFILDQIDGKFLQMFCDYGTGFRMCNAGMSNFKIMPDGNIYPCAFVINNEKFNIGNIKETINMRKAKILILEQINRRYLGQCIDCKISGFCHGMKCGFLNYMKTGHLNIPSSSLCKMEKVMYKEVKRIIEYILSDNNLINIFNGFCEFVDEENLELTKLGLSLYEKMERMQNEIPQLPEIS